MRNFRKFIFRTIAIAGLAGLTIGTSGGISRGDGGKDVDESGRSTIERGVGSDSLGGRNPDTTYTYGSAAGGTTEPATETGSGCSKGSGAGTGGNVDTGDSGTSGYGTYKGSGTGGTSDNSEGMGGVYKYRH